jgi:protein MPAN
MTEAQREAFSRHVLEAFKDFGPQDIAMIIPFLTSNGPFQKLVISKLIEFLTNEMRMQIID